MDIDKVHFGPVYDNYPLALQAALEGQGLVMASRPFAAAELANGRLIQPFNLSVNESASWFGSLPIFQAFQVLRFQTVSDDVSRMKPIELLPGIGNDIIVIFIG